MENTMKKLILIIGVCMLFVFGGCVAYPSTEINISDTSEILNTTFGYNNGTLTNISNLRGSEIVLFSEFVYDLEGNLIAINKR